MRKLIIALRDNEMMAEVYAVLDECKDGEISLTMAKEPNAIKEMVLSELDAVVIMSQTMADNVLMRIPYGASCTDYVVVSDTRSFDGARRAFRAGALDYFVLPEDASLMAEFLRSSSTRIERSIQNSAIHRMSTVNAALRVIYDEFINPAAIDALDSVYGDKFRTPYAVLCMPDSDIGTLAGIGHELLFNDRVGQAVMVVSMDKLESAERWADEISAGASTAHVGFAGLHSAYHEAFSARKTAFVLNHSLVRYSIDDISASDDYTDRELEQALQMLASGKLEEAVKIMQQMFQRAASGKLSFDEVEWFISTFISRACIYCSFDNAQEEFKAFANPWQFENASVYIAQLSEFLEEYVSRADGETDVSRNKQKIQRAIEYINENYSGVLNMAIVSNHVSMNYSLFSLEFKRYTKMNFVKYLQNFRIKESMRLLVSTDYKISEISRMTGFRDDKHFMKVFKSICGVSPSEYRRNNTSAVVGAEG